MSGLIREYEVNGDNYDEEKERYSLWKEKDAGCFVHYIAGHRAGLRFCRCYLQKRSILSGPDELYQGHRTQNSGLEQIRWEEIFFPAFGTADGSLC